MASSFNHPNFANPTEPAMLAVQSGTNGHNNH
jgi:hypothetical protein